MATYYIGADMHNNSTKLAIEKGKKIVATYSVPTTIPAISNVLDSLHGSKHLTFEEGPMAGWLYRNLNGKVDELVVCDPRRNKLICSDGDSDDKIDAAKLALLLRGGYLREVYQTDSDQRAELKHWVNLYHDRVRDAVHVENKQSVRRRIALFTIRPQQINGVDFVEVILMASRSLSRLRVPFSHWTGFLLSPHSVNEPQPIFCYASIICMDCPADKSHIGGWQHSYDCPQIQFRRSMSSEITEHNSGCRENGCSNIG
jgi:hypothetical protein